MGCDIHPFVERYMKEKQKWIPVDPPKQPKKEWQDWGKYARKVTDVEALSKAHTKEPDIEPEIAESWNFGRNYEAFANLAGVRRDDEPVFCEPRGIPDDVSNLVLMAFSTRIVTNDEYASGTSEGVSEEVAKSWFKSRTISTYRIDGNLFMKSPDCHSATYYTLEELDSCLKEHSKKASKRIKELATEMRKVMKKYGLKHDQVRVVLWFDN